MLINIIGGWLLLSGLAAAAMDFHWGPRLLLYVPSILLGIGLLRRVAVARTVVMGVCLFTSVSLLAVPAFLYFHLGGIDRIAQTAGVAIVVGLLPIGTFASLAAKPWVTIGIAALALGSASLAAYLVYRYFRREDVAAQFGDDRWFGMGLVYGRLDLKVYLVALLCGSPLLAAAVEVQREEFRKHADEDSARLMNLVRRLQLSADGRSLVTVSGSLMSRRPAETTELFSIRLADGAITRRHGPRYAMNDGDIFAWRPVEPLWSRLSPDNRLFVSTSPWNTALTDLHADETRVLDSLSARWPVPMGFTSDSSFLYFSGHAGGKVELLDVRDQRVVYSVDATRREWFLADGERAYFRRLEPAIQRGRLSPDRRRYAYVYRGVLHIVDTHIGALTLVEGPFNEYGKIVFSSESDALVVGTRPDSQSTAVLHRIGSATIPAPALKGSTLFLSTAAGSLIQRGDSGVSEFALSDLSQPARRLELANPHSAVVTADGRYLLARGPRDTLQLMELPLKDPSAFRSLVTKISFGDGPMELGIHGDFVTIVHNPLVEILDARSMAERAPASVLVDLGKARW